MSGEHESIQRIRAILYNAYGRALDDDDTLGIGRHLEALQADIEMAYESRRKSAKAYNEISEKLDDAQSHIDELRKWVNEVEGDLIAERSRVERYEKLVRLMGQLYEVDSEAVEGMIDAANTLPAAESEGAT